MLATIIAAARRHQATTLQGILGFRKVATQSGHLPPPITPRHRTKSHAMVRPIFFAFVAILVSSPVVAQPFYIADFQNGPSGAEWSNARVRLFPDGSQRFLGAYTNESTTLTLGSIPVGSLVRFHADFYAINSWDGNGPLTCCPGCEGPDMFTVRLGTSTLLSTTFAIVAACQTQAFPDNAPAQNLGGTGRTTACSCGWRWGGANGMANEGGAVTYPLDFVVIVPSPGFQMTFTASGLWTGDLNNELWGLDNVRIDGLWLTAQPVSAISCPVGSAIFAVGASGTNPIAYQWEVWSAGSMAWTPLPNGPILDIGMVTGATTSTLMINRTGNPFYPSGQSFRCIVSNPEGTVMTSEATLTVCPANFNCDGFVNSQDFYDFLSPFFDGDADFNRDGITNSQDFFDFLAAFFIGC